MLGLLNTFFNPEKNFNWSSHEGVSATNLLKIFLFVDDGTALTCPANILPVERIDILPRLMLTYNKITFLGTWDSHTIVYGKMVQYSHLSASSILSFFLFWHSNSFVTGFKADWLAICGQTLTEETGTIQSPNYPSPYINNEHCEFLIKFDDAFKYIKLT